MIRIRDHDEIVRKIAGEFLVFTIHYVQDLKSWAEGKGIDLGEPAQPMKLMALENRLMLFVQEYIDDESLDKIITAMAVRWSLRDNVSDPARTLNSARKKIAYCFFKEYARTLKGIAGDELAEDNWVIGEMERFGFFRE